MAQLAQTYASVPGTERGRGILVAGDLKTACILYCSGRSVIIRSLKDPSQLQVYGEHGYPVTVARFSPNGEWIASGDVSGTVRVWARNNEDRTLRFEIRALSGSIDDLDWSPDGERIVVCGDGKGSTFVKAFFNLSGLDSVKLNPKSIARIVVYGDGKGSTFVKAFLWDSGSTVGEFDGHSKRVLSCAFKPSRPFRIITCGEDFLVNFYEGPPFRFKTSNREHVNFVNCIRFSPDGGKFLSVGSDKNGFLFDGKTGEKLGTLSAEDGHSGSIYAASWSPSGKQVLTVSADKTAKIWDISTDGSGKVNTTFSFSDIGGADDMQVGCLWMGEYILTISLGGVITYLSPSSPNSPSRTLSGHLRSITALAVAKEGESMHLYSSSFDGVIIKWKVGSGYIRRLPKFGTVNPATYMVAQGSNLMTCGIDHKFRSVPLPGGAYTEAEALDLGSLPRDLDVARNCPEVAIVPAERSVILLHQGAVASTIDVDYFASAAALSPDGEEAVVGGQNGKLYVYSVKGDTLTQEAVLEKHRGEISAVRYSPDGTMIASGDLNREAVVWDRISREVKVKNMLYHTARVNAVAWSPDSAQVATTSVDSSIYVYDVAKAASARIAIRNAHLGGVSALVFIDAQTLASGGDDACVRIWTLS